MCRFSSMACLPVLLGLLTACGGNGGGGGTDTVLSVQLTRAAAPATPYTVAQMKVTLHQDGSPDRTATTNASGIASFPITAAGTCQVTQVQGADVTGAVLGTEGREFIKPTPLVSALALVDYVPAVKPSVSVAGSSPVTLNVPVPDLRKVTVIAQGADSEPNTSNPIYTTPQAAGFAGRVILRNIHFSVNDGIIVFGSTGSNHFTLVVQENNNLITGTLYAPGATNLANIASGVPAWPYVGPITLEVPSDSDWALQSHSTLTTHQAYPQAFGLLAGGTILQIYNFGVVHNPAGTNALAYEVQLFGDAELP